MTTYLMHRMSHEGERAKELLGERNDSERLISIGWGSLKDEEKSMLMEAARADRETFREVVSKINKDGLSGQRSWFLYNFLRLSENDIVVIPFPGEVSIFKVVNNPRIFSDKKDLGFVIPVTAVAENISRKKYITGEFSRKLKSRGTNLILESHLVDELIINHKKGRNVSEAINETKAKLIEVVQEYIKKSNNDLSFERIIKQYFKNIGADEVTIPSKNLKLNDNEFIADVDVKAKFEKLKLMIYVQAKLHEDNSNLYGAEQLAAFKVEYDNDASDYQVIKWLINTGTVTLVESEGQSLYEGIRVIQKDEFAEMLVESGFKFDQEIYNL